MFTLTDFLENTAARTLPLKPFERTFQGLIFTDTNLRHSYPSSRSSDILTFPEAGLREKLCTYYMQKQASRQSFF